MECTWPFRIDYRKILQNLDAIVQGGWKRILPERHRGGNRFPGVEELKFPGEAIVAESRGNCTA